MRVPSNTGSKFPTQKPSIDKVAEHIDDVVTVATSITSGQFDKVSVPAVGVVAGIHKQVVAVAEVEQYVRMLALDLSNVDKVAEELGGVLNVSNNMATVLLLHSRMADLMNIQKSLVHIDAVALNEEAINSVFEAIPEITTLVAHLGDLIKMAQALPHLEAVFDNLDALILTGFNISHVVRVSENMETILEASVYVAEIYTLMEEVRGIEANVIALEASTKNQADIATEQADIATSKASEATVQANAASSSATAANASAVAAKASEASATASATTATNKAAEAANSAASTLDSKDEATAAINTVNQVKVGVVAIGEHVDAVQVIVDAHRAEVASNTSQVAADKGLVEAAKIAAMDAAGISEANKVSTEQNAESAKTDSAAAKTARDEAVSAAGTAVSASAAVLDAERRSLERATGGKQTIIYDAAGNANAMFVLPRFRYEDLGMTAAMGSGDVTAFDFGSGSIKGEIFFGAYLASGSGAVSAPRQDPSVSLNHTAARNACSEKGAGWHLMTAHEWAAIALWCMANGYEPIGNTNRGCSHAKAWKVGDRADNRAPGDAAGQARTLTGSMGSEATHTRTLGGIADLVGNVSEWQDGFLLQDGRFKLSSHNTQAEVDWAFADAFLDASTPTGGSVILSNAVNNRLGAIGDNNIVGNSANVERRAMTKSGSYVSNQAMKRLLLEPANALPQGRIYIRNFGERLPFRGGAYATGADAGLAALNLNNSRVSTYTNIGFRPAFA